MRISRLKFSFLIAAISLAGFQTLGAAVIAYTNDFSGTGSNTAFSTESPDAEWTVAGGVYAFSTSNTMINPSTTSIQITNAGGVNFQMETQFTVSDFGNPNTNGATLGMGLFGADALFGGSNVGTSYYLADWQVANSGTPGNLRIRALGDTTGFTNVEVNVDDNLGSGSLAANLNTTYTLRLVGTYSGGTLNMTLGIYDAAGTIQIGTFATATDTSPLTGTNFGYRNRIGIGGGTFSADFDNFSVVPEPGSVPLLMLASVGAIFFKRRRRA